MTRLIVFIIAVLPNSLCAGALVFGTPQTCNDRAISWVLSPDKSALSILFSGLALSTNATTGTKRTACELRIPVSVQNTTLIGADWRGFYDLASNFDLLQENIWYGLGSNQDVPKSDITRGARTDTYVHSHILNASCPGNYVLRILVQNFLSSLSKTQNASHALDSLDLSQTQTSNASLNLCKQTLYQDSAGFRQAFSWFQIFGRLFLGGLIWSIV